MKFKTTAALAAACAMGLGTATFIYAARADQQGQAQGHDDKGTDPGKNVGDFLKECPNTGIFGNPPIYFPYPRRIIPRDLCKEIQRVRREVKVVYDRYLAQSKALTPPTLTSQPPTLQGTGYEAVRILGGLMNYDERISVGGNVACAFCHMPYAGFSGPIPSVNLTMIAYPGSYLARAGKRNPQRYPYSPRFPVFHLNGGKNAGVGGTFTGGNFWDGRATGYKLQSPDAEQAQHPPVDSQEMGSPDTACIAFKLSQAEYRPLFELVWGDDFDIQFPSNTQEICATPEGAAQFGTSATPINLSPVDRTKANNIYDHWGQSISFLESSNDISPFTSKFDRFLAEAVTLTPDEQAGYSLFRGQAGCNSCHLDGRGTTQTPDTGSDGTPSTVTGTDTSAPADLQPLFTCFAYANLGLPLNPRDAFYYQTTPDFFGFTPNPLGFGYRDLGLGTFLRSGFGSGPNPNAVNWLSFATTSDGQMQTSTARNVAMTPPNSTTEAPGPYFQKEFFHNGYIKSLKQLVHFYNTRDVYAFKVTSGHCPKGTTEKVDCWPMPEVPNNIDMTVGNLGLTDQEENQIVVFLQTLTDGFDPANPTVSNYPNIDTFTGQLMTGGNASTQGNEHLIPTPPLPPCSPEVCGVAPLPGPLAIQ
ncbi:MAG: Cytochrome c peroxidase family protein [Rhodospirillales bacterium]|nr:Cytochrome c peroxidase family protein [Rhodospirillales bacterium]